MKARLAYAWRERPAVEVVPALTSALSAAPRSVRTATYRYHHAQVVVTPVLVHEVHVLYDLDAKRALVSWTGRGVRSGTVVMTEGLGLDAVRRRIEGGALSSVPRAVPAPPRVRKRASKPGPAVVKRLPAPASAKALPPP